jgi:hypothetical protein
MKNKCYEITCYNDKGIYPTYCFIHTLQYNNVFISPSNIKNAGYGLFAGPKGFKKNDIIGEYSTTQNKTTQGEILKNCNNTYNNTYIDSCWKYTLCKSNILKDDIVCWNDTDDINSTYVRYINDAYNTKFKNNSEFNIKNDNAYVIASTDIKPYQEIFVSYGSSYWS